MNGQKLIFIAAEPRIEVVMGARVAAVLGHDRLEAVRIETASGTQEREAVGLVIKAGSIPNTEWCAGALALDGEGYVLVDDRLAASQASVWAIGDVTRPERPSLPLALGHGALAMAAIRDALKPAGN